MWNLVNNCAMITACIQRVHSALDTVPSESMSLFAAFGIAAAQQGPRQASDMSTVLTENISLIQQAVLRRIHIWLKAAPEPPLQHIIWPADFSKSERQRLRRVIQEGMDDYPGAWKSDLADADLAVLVESLNNNKIPYAKAKKQEIIRRVVVQLRSEKTKDKKKDGSAEQPKKKRKSDEFIVDSDEDMGDMDKENRIPA
jgi:hypothetical protein